MRKNPWFHFTRGLKLLLSHPTPTPTPTPTPHPTSPPPPPTQPPHPHPHPTPSTLPEAHGRLQLRRLGVVAGDVLLVPPTTSAATRQRVLARFGWHGLALGPGGSGEAYEAFRKLVLFGVTANLFGVTAIFFGVTGFFSRLPLALRETVGPT